jgi:hypothetical protein
VDTVSRVALIALFALTAEVIAQQDLVSYADMLYGFTDFSDDTSS